MSLNLFTKHNHPWIFGTSVFCLKKVNSSGVPRLWVLFTKTLQYQHIQHAKPAWNSSNAMLADWKPPKIGCFNLWWVFATTFQASPSCRHPPNPRRAQCLVAAFLSGFLRECFAFPVIVVFPSRIARLLTLVAQHFAEAARQTMALRPETKQMDVDSSGCFDHAVKTKKWVQKMTNTYI